MSTDTLDLPRIDADFDSAEPVRTEVAVAAAASIDFEKVDLAKLLIAKFGNWRPLVAKLKADNASTVHDLSTQTKVDEAVSLRNRTINMPLAEARRIDKALASVMSKARKKLGAELEEMEKGYDEAAQPLSKQIEDAQKKIDDDKEAKRLAEETRLNGLRANVDGVMARWLARCEVEGITAVRIGMGIGMLQELAMPPDVSDVAAHWTTAKAATLVSMRTLEREAAHREEEARLETQRAELARQRWEVLHQQMDVAFDAASLRAGAAAAEAVRDSFLTTHGHRAEWTEPNIGQAYVQAMNLLQPQPVEQKPEAVKLQFTAAMPAADAGTAAATESADREGGEPRAEPEAAPKFEEQQPQQVLKAEPATADATDRGTAADASPVGGPMGAGEPAAAGPAGGATVYGLGPGRPAQFADRTGFGVIAIDARPADEPYRPSDNIVEGEGGSALQRAAGSVVALVRQAMRTKFPTQPKVGPEWWSAMYAAVELIEATGEAIVPAEEGRLLMPSVNKVIVVGNLGRDPELRYAANGAAVCSMTVATSRQWKDKTSGERQEETEWHRIVFYERMAEVAGEYLKKGRPVYVEGRLKTRKWTDKDGVERYSTEIIGSELQMLGAREEGEDRAPAPSQRSSAPTPRTPAPPPPRPAPRQQPNTGFDDMDDDIPF